MITAASSDIFTSLRLRMVETQLRERGIADERVLGAMARVLRHEFVPERYRDQAYEDHPVPIGEGQTISQPYIVALMLELLAINSNDKVLEIGTGSAYATVLLAELAAQVVSVERHAGLANEAGDRLLRVRDSNVSIIIGDGNLGYAASAPYDAILVSAAASAVPPMLLTQLAEGGRMVIPIGNAETQQLQLIQMQNGQPRITLRALCRFVPLLNGVERQAP
jgi:protein-L-isoaspartate(D-aspartate) O-methyltransferase